MSKEARKQAKNGSMGIIAYKDTGKIVDVLWYSKKDDKFWAIGENYDSELTETYSIQEYACKFLLDVEIKYKKAVIEELKKMKEDYNSGKEIGESGSLSGKALSGANIALDEAIKKAKALKIKMLNKKQ